MSQPARALGTTRRRPPVFVGRVASILAVAASACGSGPMNGAAVAPPSADPSGVSRFESLRDLTVANGVGSIDDLLPLLPASLRSRYVLMHESRSLQEASYRAPRAILYSRDASFIVTFNGDPSKGGYRSLETMEYDDRRGTFQLREISFDTDGDGRRVPVFSEPNPAVCGDCHGDDPRPIWDAYPAWPGAYGEVERHRDSPEVTAGLAAFLAERRENPRYRALLGAESLAALLSAASDAAYRGREAPSPNADFGLKLQRLVYRAVGRQVIGAPRFGAYQYALLAALDPQCLDIESFLPAVVLTRFDRRARPFARDTEQANAEQAAAKTARMRRAADAATPSPTETLLPFRFVVEEGLHLSTKGWTLALERGTYDFTTGRNSTTELERDILEQVARVDPSVRDLRVAPDRRDGYCAALRRRSLAALAE